MEGGELDGLGRIFDELGRLRDRKYCWSNLVAKPLSDHTELYICALCKFHVYICNAFGNLVQLPSHFIAHGTVLLPIVVAGNRNCPSH